MCELQGKHVTVFFGSHETCSQSKCILRLLFRGFQKEIRKPLCIGQPIITWCTTAYKAYGCSWIINKRTSDMRTCIRCKLFEDPFVVALDTHCVLCLMHTPIGARRHYRSLPNMTGVHWSPDWLHAWWSQNTNHCKLIVDPLSEGLPLSVLHLPCSKQKRLTQ